MSAQLNFENRVVIVTGSGAGLGRSHALEYAARGAKVVVNDLGGGTAGGGNDSSVADALVEEIRAAGGNAVANGDSVEQGAKIVECAMDNFGKIDVVVNNAGILRDSAFHKMTDDDWEIIQRVHLWGSYSVTRAAWPYMRANAYGRIIMTTSAAGIYGNFGQANYAAAKLGIHGLGQALAIEGRGKNILVNTIAPIAASRLTESVMPAAMLEVLDPKVVTPLAILLTHESHAESGQLFEVGGGWVSRIRLEQSQGARFDPKAGFSPEQLAAKWDDVQSFENSMRPQDITNTLKVIGDIVGVDLSLSTQ
jgi:3-hydroxyacyl-CoA dehydrogenase/3a,7a,12a-trihydroxy-5b-cholest-24-enoyl-CoA hydratase